MSLIWVGLCILPVLLLIWLPLFLIWRSMKRHGWVWKTWRPVKVKPAPEKPVEIASDRKEITPQTRNSTLEGNTFQGFFIP